MVHVMLVCNAGMSTAMLAQKINKNSDGYCYVEAFGEGEYQEHIDDFDIILVGPQIRHLMKVDSVVAQIKKILED